MCGTARVYLEGQTKTWPISGLYLFRSPFHTQQHSRLCQLQKFVLQNILHMVCKKVDKLSNVFTNALTAVKLCPAVFVIYVTRLPPEFLDCRLSPTVGHHTQTHPNTTPSGPPTPKPKSQWKGQLTPCLAEGLQLQKWHSGVPRVDLEHASVWLKSHFWN